MKKAAFFVEGQTEQLLVEKLLTEVAGQKQLTVVQSKARGSGEARMHEFRAHRPSGDYYALVVDCGTDNRVVSDVRDHYDSLVAHGYGLVVGLRDVYPEPRANLERMQRMQYYKMPTKPIHPRLILAVMEVECWFLAEATHFERLDPALSCARIKEAFGFDPSIDDMQLRNNPAADLHQIYGVVNLAYRKSRNHVQRTLTSLDYANLYVGIAERIPALGELVAAIDTFLS